MAGSKSPLGTGTIGGGNTFINAAYEPLYVADTYNNRIVRIDDMTGDNWVAFGKSGGGVNKFNLPYDIAVDTAGKIYVTDGGNCRSSAWTICRDELDVVRPLWFTGNHQFSNPTGLFVDSAGKIYVTDTGNNRVVRINDIAGDGWMSYGAVGSGAGQFRLAGGCRGGFGRQDLCRGPEQCPDRAHG